MPPLPTIACKECGHVNEGERVYCHNCGTKLDRSTLAVQQQKIESNEQRRRRVYKLLNPNGWFSPIRFLREATKTVAYAALAAVFIDAALPPEDVPEMPQTKVAMDAPDLGIVLENLAATAPGQKFRISEKEINGYLKNTVRTKPDGNWLSSFVEFQRAFANIQPESFRITSQNAIYGYPFYTGLTFKLSNWENKSVHQIAGANVGRLWIPPEIAIYLIDFFDPVKNALKRELASLDRIGAVEAKQGEVIVASPGVSAPATSATTPSPTPRP